DRQRLGDHDGRRAGRGTTVRLKPDPHELRRSAKLQATYGCHGPAKSQAKALAKGGSHYTLVRGVRLQAALRGRSMGNADSDRTAHARATEPAVPVRVLRKILLVVILGVEKFWRRENFGRDGAKPGT